MKSIVVLSGKGGVGKSSITASLADVLSKKIVCADCDVDASNLSLLFSLNPKDYEEWIPLSTNQKAVIDKEKCIQCGKCINTCYFNALEWKKNIPTVSKFGCEGCGACVLVCPVNAITLENINNATIGYAQTKKGFFIASAQLLPGSSGSGKVVSEVKKKAKEIAPKAEIMLIDASAGIGCPVIASVAGSDYALLITEPTPSGFSDLKRALKVVDHFNIPKGIIINKFDINLKFTESIREFADEEGIEIIEEFQFDRAFVKAMNKMIPLTEFNPDYKDKFERIAKKVLKSIA